MASVAPRAPRIATDHRFFLTSAIVMAAVNVAGFSLQYAMGRSSFAAPLYVHVHAVTFFGWMGYYVLQNALAATGSVRLHKRLGWIGVGWAVALVVLGTYTTIRLAQRARVPFFFTPAYFEPMDILSVLCFAALVGAAIVLRRRTRWHRRLMFCGVAIIMAPAIGRLLPLPLLIPYAGLAVFAVILLFPIAGIAADLRRWGRVHPAWWAGLAALVTTQIAIEVIGHSVLGVAWYRLVTAGTPGAAVPPLAFPPGAAPRADPPALIRLSA